MELELRMRRVRAVVAHETATTPPLRLQRGDVVEVVKRDTEWPGFVLVTAAQGTGWVPARHLSADTATAVTIVPYDTTEVATSVGEVLEDGPGGWLWVRNAARREGWVPLRTVEAAG